MVDLGEIANKITEWSNTTEKGVIYQAWFVADLYDPSIMQVELWPFKATSEDKDLRHLEEIMLAYGHWAKHLYNLGSDPASLLLVKGFWSARRQ